jgi:hypothetical protein
MFQRSMLLLIALFVLAAPAWLQPNTEADITFPPPVFVVGGEADIVGTANVLGQVNYFIEYRPLGDDLLPRDGEDTPWFPATLPRTRPVTDGPLGVWDTTVAPDGLYELRLKINLQNGEPRHVVVSPLRVDNASPEPDGPLDGDDAIASALLALTATAGAGLGAQPGAFATPAPLGTRDPLQPTPTDGIVVLDGETTAQVIVVANLRAGDSTLFGVNAALDPGTELVVLGRSNRNNWLLVETPDGTEGWVAPSVVTLRGSILDVEPVQPPVPPVTPTPVPTATPEVPPLADAVITSVRADRDVKEGEAFQIIVGVRNDGVLFLPESQLFCNVEPMNASVSVNAGNLEPGGSTNVALPLRLEEGGGSDVTIICRIDMNEFVVEPNEDNNFGRATVSVDD